MIILLLAPLIGGAIIFFAHHLRTRTRGNRRSELTDQNTFLTNITIVAVIVIAVALLCYLAILRPALEDLAP